MQRKQARVTAVIPRNKYCYQTCAISSSDHKIFTDWTVSFYWDLSGGHYQIESKRRTAWSNTE